MSLLFRGQSGGSSQKTSENDSWYVTYGIQEAYDTIVKEAEAWKEKAASRKKGMFSFLSGRKPSPFVVEKEVSPRLYRLRDSDVGEISFELTELEGGGTSIKSTYDRNARSLIQDLRARMPGRIPASGPKVCPSCGKEMLPDFTTCPYCGTKLR